MRCAEAARIANVNERHEAEAVELQAEAEPTKKGVQPYRA